MSIENRKLEMNLIDRHGRLYSDPIVFEYVRNKTGSLRADRVALPTLLRIVLENSELEHSRGIEARSSKQTSRDPN